MPPGRRLRPRLTPAAAAAAAADIMMGRTTAQQATNHRDSNTQAEPPEARASLRLSHGGRFQVSRRTAFWLASPVGFLARGPRPARPRRLKESIYQRTRSESSRHRRQSGDLPVRPRQGLRVRVKSRSSCGRPSFKFIATLISTVAMTGRGIQEWAPPGRWQT